METLKFIQSDRHITEIVLQEEVWYAMDLDPHASTWRITRTLGKPDVELASILYADWNDTRVKLGEKSYDVNAFLRRKNIYSNSRIFVASDGETYKWSIRGHHLELRHAHTHAMVARSHSKELNYMFSRKRENMSLDVLPEYVLGKDSKMLDAVVITFIIMQHKLEERTKYRRGSWY